MQDQNALKMSVINEFLNDEVKDDLKARIANIASAYKGKYLYKLIENLNDKIIRDDIRLLEILKLPIDPCLYNVAAITSLFHDKTKHYFTVDELFEIEKNGIENYLKTKENADTDSVNKLDECVLKHIRQLKPQVSNFDLPPRSELLKYLQELISHYNNCAPYDEIVCNYSDWARDIFRACTQLMTTLLALWPPKRQFRLQANRGEGQLDYAAINQIVARMRRDALPKDQRQVDALVSTIELCVSCDEIDSIMEQADNPAVRQELEAQLQDCFKKIMSSLLEKSLHQDRYETIDAPYFRKLILINIDKYSVAPYQHDPKQLGAYLDRLLEDLFHVYFNRASITLSNYKDYMQLALECSYKKGFSDYKVEVEQCFKAYLIAWVESIKVRQDKRTSPGLGRVGQSISQAELAEHRSVIDKFECPKLLLSHYDQLMQLITVDFSTRDGLLAFIKDAFAIAHPNAHLMLRNYYRSYAEHLVSRSYGCGHDLDGRIIGVKCDELQNWNTLLNQVVTHWHAKKTGYVESKSEEFFREPAQQGFDFRTSYLEIIYRYFSHTHITPVNVDFAFEMLSALKKLQSPETKKILLYFYADFSVFTHHARRPNFLILKRMLTLLSLEKDLSAQEKQSLMGPYLNALLREVIMPEMIKDPKPSRFEEFVSSRLYFYDVQMMIDRVGNDFNALLSLCNSIINCNKKIMGSDPLYVEQLKEIVAIVSQCLAVEVSSLSAPKKVVEEDESPKKSLMVNIQPSDFVDGPSLQENKVDSLRVIPPPAAKPAAVAQLTLQQSAHLTENNDQSKPLPPPSSGSETVKTADLKKITAKPSSTELSAHFIHKNAAESEKGMAKNLAALSSIMKKAPAVPVDDLDEIDADKQDNNDKGKAEINYQRMKPQI